MSCLARSHPAFPLPQDITPHNQYYQGSITKSLRPTSKSLRDLQSSLRDITPFRLFIFLSWRDIRLRVIQLHYDNHYGKSTTCNHQDNQVEATINEQERKIHEEIYATLKGIDAITTIERATVGTEEIHPQAVDDRYLKLVHHLQTPTRLPPIIVSVLVHKHDL